MSPSCVIFGANGFIGSALTRMLLSAGYSVLACDLVREFYALEEHPRLTCRTVDFLDEVAVRNAVTGADWVFHLVSTTKPASSCANMSFDVQTNVVPSIHLFQACVDAGVQRVVFASSGGTVYGPPQSLPVSEDHVAAPVVSYGLTKLVIEGYAELFRRQFGLVTVSLRIGNPYGPRQYDDQQGVIPVFIRRVRRGQPIQIWGDGGVIRDYVHVDDVARAFVAAAGYQGHDSVFNVGSGEGRSLRDIVRMLEELAGHEVLVEYTPARGFDVPAIVLDRRRAQDQLGWAPQITFSEGLERTWYANA